MLEKIVNAFGRLWRSVSSKPKNSVDQSGKMPTGKEKLTGVSTEESKTLIWGVVEGPFAIEDFPEEELIDMGIDPDQEAWMLVCKIEEDGKIGLANFWYPTLDEANAVKWYFDSNIEPLEVKNG
jgi:hypothetical protein